MKKQILSILCVSVFIFALTSCSDSGSSPVEKNEVTVSDITAADDVSIDPSVPPVVEPEVKLSSDEAKNIAGAVFNALSSAFSTGSGSSANTEKAIVEDSVSISGDVWSITESYSYDDKKIFPLTVNTTLTLELCDAGIITLQNGMADVTLTVNSLTSISYVYSGDFGVYYKDKLYPLSINVELSISNFIPSFSGTYTIDGTTYNITDATFISGITNIPLRISDLLNQLTNVDVSVLPAVIWDAMGSVLDISNIDLSGLDISEIISKIKDLKESLDSAEDFSDIASIILQNTEIAGIIDDLKDGVFDYSAYGLGIQGYFSFDYTTIDLWFTSIQVPSAINYNLDFTWDSFESAGVTLQDGYVKAVISKSLSDILDEIMTGEIDINNITLTDILQSAFTVNYSGDFEADYLTNQFEVELDAAQNFDGGIIPVSSSGTITINGVEYNLPSIN